MSPQEHVAIYSGPVYWDKVRDRAKELGSDGCTGVIDFYKDACLEHDVHYHLKETLGGRVLTRRDADTIFRLRIMGLSPLGVLSIVAWVRWIGVRLFGAFLW